MSALAQTEAPSLAESMRDLFAGDDQHHGTYDPGRLRLVGEKMEMKDESGNGALTVPGPPTVERWLAHLDGTTPLGVRPVRKDGACRWGVIDSDDYTIGLPEIVASVKKNDLPLVVCRSKSGGAHLFLFATDWVTQATMHEALTACRRVLRLAKGETFPPRDGPGNWLNMPYFGGDQSDRHGVKPNGLAMSVPEFLSAVEAKQVFPHKLEQIAAREGPPGAGNADRRATDAGEGCHRARRALDRFADELSATPEGSRATLLYGRAKDMGRMVGARWIEENEVIARLVEAGVASGLTSFEALGHIRRGIADGIKEPPEEEPDADRYPTIERIVVLVGGEEETWRLTLAEGGDITLPVREVMHYYTFNTRCAARLRVSFRQLKNDAWSDRINEALRHATEEQVPRDETPEWVFFEQLYSFCMDKHRANSIDEIILGKPWQDEDEDRVYFTVSDLQSHLARGSTILKSASLRRIGALLNDLGPENADTGKTTKKIKGRPKELRWVRLSMLDRMDTLDLPPVPGDPL